MDRLVIIIDIKSLNVLVKQRVKFSKLNFKTVDFIKIQVLIIVKNE